MKFSIVMSYFRRPQLLCRTLESIYRQANKPCYEIIIVNDDVCNSPRDDELERICRLYKEKMQCDIRLFITERTTPCRGPALPWNIGAKFASGDILVIQNPECMHVGCVLDNLKAIFELRANQYVSVRCISLKSNDDVVIDACNAGLLDYNKIRELDHPARQEYIGPTNPRLLYFCGALPRQLFYDVGGIEESFVRLAYEDDFFVYTVQKNNIPANIVGNKEWYVMHQWHPTYLTSEYWSALHESQGHYNLLLRQIDRDQRSPIANLGRQWGELGSGREIVL